jgi:sortase A
MMQLWRAGGTAVLLLASWQAGAALYVPAKGWLAQLLLERAWSSAAAGASAAKPWPWADTVPVARLRAPVQGVDLIVLAGASGRTLAFGPGLADGTARPGIQGASVIAGHRDTHFAFLRELRIGDELDLERRDGASEHFVVRSTEVVDSRSSRLRIVQDARALVLVTCFPFDAVVPGGPLRYVVTAEPVRVGAGSDPGSELGQSWL